MKKVEREDVVSLFHLSSSSNPDVSVFFSDFLVVRCTFLIFFFFDSYFQSSISHQSGEKEEQERQRMMTTTMTSTT